MQLDEAQRIFDLTFAQVDGFSLSMHNRKQLELENKVFTYGEITFSALKSILDNITLGDNEIFLQF